MKCVYGNVPSSEFKCVSVSLYSVPDRFAVFIMKSVGVCVQSLRQYKDAQKEAEVLMKALSDMQDKNKELENSLSTETRFKQDLFSALGEERRVIKVLQSEWVCWLFSWEISERNSLISVLRGIINGLVRDDTFLFSWQCNFS